MLHVMVLRYLGPPDQIAALVTEHVSYLDQAHDEGRFLVSGQTVPDTLGGVILAVGSREEIEQVAATDPFVTSGLAAYEIVTVDPSRIHADLRDLVPAPEPENDWEDWDNAANRRLRTGDLQVLTEGRQLRPVGQQAGDLLLAMGPDKNPELTQNCLRALRDRDWAGDGVLCDELVEALGQTPGEPRQLVPVPVSLNDLATSLEGDRSHGYCAVDLKTGMVYHPGMLEYDRPAEMDEDTEAFDPDRWLFFTPESGEGYRDMLDFAATFPEGRNRDGLFRALDGRGAFRRFRDALYEIGDPHIARWNLFSDERHLGRAREWLAGEGYRAIPETAR